EWIQQNNILSIVLRDSLHQPQYVEKLEKILRFVIKEKALTLQDLDNIWAAQAGKHEAIVKNVHDLLAKLAWDFSPEQLDHLFDCFKILKRRLSRKLLDIPEMSTEDRDSRRPPPASGAPEHGEKAAAGKVEPQAIAPEASGVRPLEEQRQEAPLRQATPGGSRGTGPDERMVPAGPRPPMTMWFKMAQRRDRWFSISSELAESASSIASLNTNEKEEGEWSGDETETKPTSSRLFQPEHFQRLLTKVVSTLNYQLEEPDKLRSSASAKLDPRGFKKPVKVQTFSLFPDYFEDVIQEEWANPGSGTSLLSIAKRFYSLPEETMEDLKVPLVDAPVVALHSGAVLPKDGENALKDATDRKNETALKKVHEAMSLAIRSAAALSNFTRATAIWADNLLQDPELAQAKQDTLNQFLYKDAIYFEEKYALNLVKASWTNASKKQREKLLELIRRLAEDDKDGVMAHKVLNLLWNLAHSDDVPVDIMDQALSAHIKILDYSCSQDRDTQKIQWIDRFIEELRTNDKWVIPALKQIREICSLFGEAPQNLSQTQRSPHVFYRHDLINQLQHNHALVTLVAENLSAYMESMRQYAKEHGEYDPQTVRLGSRYSHVQEVQERLNFLRFLLKDGQLWLCAPQAKQIWKCLAENAVYLCDREACFKWYSKLMGDEPDLDPDINKDFFENNVLQLDPSLLTENGMKCFERFFKAVNCREGKLVAKRRAYMMDDLELIGLDYLWRVVIQGNDDIASRAIDLLKEIYTNLGPRLQVNQVVIHEDFIQSCFDRLKASYDTLCVLDGDKDSINCARQEAIRMVRVLTVLREYINECDSDYHEERTILPMSRAFRGKHISLVVRFPNQGRQVEDLDVWSHTNDTIGSVRRCILNRIKANSAHTKVELFIGGELVDPADDRKLIGQLNLKDKTLITAKLTQISSNMPSSPDSSSDSSTGSPGNHGNHYGDGPNPEVESCLPGVIMSLHPRYISFLWQVADLGSSLNMPPLRDGARILMKLMPPDNTTVEKLRAICLDHAKLGESSLSPSLDSLFFGPSASQVLYLTEVVYALLMPANLPLGEDATDFQYNFLKSGGLPLVLSMLTRNNFLPNADMETRRGAYLNALKIAKVLLTAIGYGHVRAVAEAYQPVVEGTSPMSPINQATHDQAVVLQTALQNIPNPTSECMLRNVAIRLAQQISDEASKYIPDICVIRAVQKIVWASGCGSVQLVFSSNEDISKIYEKTNAGNEPDAEDEQVCCEALEAMTLCFALIPTALDALSKEKAWQTFIIDLLLHCHSKTVRQMAQEQFFLMATRCCMGQRPLLFFITLLFTVLGSTARERAKHSGDYFTLLRHLLNYAYNSNINVPNAEVLLNNEIDWLKRIRDEVKRTGETGVEETILEGHLGVTKELLAFQTPEKKYHIGCEKGGANLIKELIDDFIFPASNVYLQYMRNGELPAEQAIPVCSSPATINAGFELLVALAVGCVRNLKQIVDTLTEMYYIGTAITTCEALTEWEYLPPVGPRPPKGFVGLKNAGATCYMNSVIQQLYMIPAIRNGILAIEGTGSDVDDDMSGDEKQDNESTADSRDEVFGYPHQYDDKPTLSKTEDRKEYNIGVLRHLQVIFGHLAASRLQYYVPRGFWKQFRLWGEPVNLREQHDALEFFNSLVDSLDEALKALGHPAMLSKVLGGSFADQKICQGCPHRYECEESFTTLNVDIRNHQNLLDSLEQYVKGDLLEGANAYHCEKCNKKVDTVKRLLIKKLPPVLAIQLKRFDYDWERECAIKFNDYFEFPRELDMEPYTVAGVAKLEGDDVNPENQLIQNEQSENEHSGSTKYRLVGVLVHSGQASGGHYYSYIIQRNGGDGEKNRWYKFDDGDVTECKMDDDEEMKNQCFGGEYMGEVFDHMMKRMSYRRQKRWWNAYILFYERMDTVDKDNELIKYISELTMTTKPHQIKMPSAIERSVRKQNVQFMHNRMQYSLEYFQFIKKLLTCNSVYLNPPPGQDHLLPEAEEITMISVQLAARFLFTTGFHTKKIVRGPASDWYDALCILLRHSKNVRFWFAHNVLFNVSNRFSEYLLECPSAEVRGAFAKLIVFIAHFSLQDGPCPSPFASPGPSSQAYDNLSLSDHLLRAVLNLLRREVSEHGRHLQQYFNLFVMYANLGVAEKTQLLKLNVPATFMLVALDEGPGPPIKYQYAELGKLYTVVSQLIRCCNVSSRMQSSINGNPPLSNPYGDPNLSQPIMALQQNVADILFVRTSYVKKIIEDCSNSEETIKLLRFCCWENPQFSSTVLSELLWQVAYSYTYELRPYLDLLLQILLIEDSWQTHRIHNALKGIPDDRDGLFDTIQRSKNHYQKRAYQCIKCMVALFSNCPVAYQILQSNGDLKRKWTWAVEWLGDELERRPYTGNPQYTYNNWSPPVQSNETSNGYFLERSHSARMTLAKACELCPEEEPDDPDAPDEHESSPPEDAPLYPHSPGSQYQQNNHVHGQPYTGPAAHHMNNPQRTGQRAQENFEGSEEVSPPQTKE
ncbi:UNVERIFIED_CONTAM: putative ubiquitin carboxyl-terminal hydrolase FAF-X, partial [Gekko kuhli]